MNPWLVVGKKMYMNPECYKDIEEYFKKVGRYRGCLFVDMKQIIARKMHSNGLTYDAIRLTLNLQNHATAIHLVKSRKSTVDYEMVSKMYESWIINGVYPFTLTVGSGHTDTHEGFNYLFKLIKV
jgi:hypothetical protein